MTVPVIVVREFGARYLPFLRYTPPPRVKAANAGKPVALTGLAADRRPPDHSRELEDFHLTPAVTRMIAREAHDLAHAWYQGSDGGTALSTQGIDLGEVIAWDMYYCLSSVLRSIELLKAARRHLEAADMLVTGDPAWNRLAAAVLEREGTRVEIRDRRRYEVAKELDRRVARRPDLRRAFGPGCEEVGDWSSAPSGSPSALFVVGGGASVEVAAAVLRSSEFSSHFQAGVLGPCAVASNFHGVAPFWSFSDSLGVVAGRVLEPDEVEAILARARDQGSFTWDGFSLFEVVAPWVRFLLARRLNEAASLVHASTRLLQDLSPKVVAVCGWDGHWINCVLIRVAQRLAIPVISIQDGDFTTELEREVKADLIALQGSRTRDHLLRSGNDADKLIVTGQPRYDRLAVPSAGERDRIRTSLNVDPDDFLVVFATDPGTGWGSRTAKIRAERNALLELGSLEGVTLLIKLHPQDDGATTRGLLEEVAPRRARVLSTPDADQLMIACDLWVCMFSTTAQEAAARGKPVVIINYSDDSYLSDLVESGLAMYAQHPGDLHRIAESLVGSSGPPRPGPEGQRVLQERLGVLDGGAGGRVARAMIGVST